MDQFLHTGSLVTSRGHMDRNRGSNITTREVRWSP
jgi:hypothetical protein